MFLDKEQDVRTSAEKRTEEARRPMKGGAVMMRNRIYFTAKQIQFAIGTNTFSKLWKYNFASTDGRTEEAQRPMKGGTVMMMRNWRISIFYC